MANRITQREYTEIKNKEVTVISFKGTGKRTLSYMGISYKTAVEHIQKEQKQGKICLIFPQNTPLPLTITQKQDSLFNYLLQLISPPINIPTPPKQ